MPRFAASYTWQHFTSGAHTTARSESLNAAVKPKIRASSTLVQLHQALRGYITTGEYKKEVTREQSFIRNSLMSLHIPPWIAVLQSKITDYAYQLLISQFQQCLAYSYSFSVGERYACTDIPLELQFALLIESLHYPLECSATLTRQVEWWPSIVNWTTDSKMLNGLIGPLLMIVLAVIFKVMEYFAVIYFVCVCVYLLITFHL